MPARTCTSSVHRLQRDEAASSLTAITGVKDVLVAAVGGGAKLVEENRHK